MRYILFTYRIAHNDITFELVFFILIEKLKKVFNSKYLIENKKSQNQFEKYKTNVNLKFII